VVLGACHPSFDSGIVAGGTMSGRLGSTWEGMYMARRCTMDSGPHQRPSASLDKQSELLQRCPTLRLRDLVRRYRIRIRGHATATGTTPLLGQCRPGAVGMDTGGFNNSSHIAGEELNEAFARWMEFAAFVPSFARTALPTVNPGLRAESRSRGEARCRLRYSLIPYMYSFERELTETASGWCGRWFGIIRTIRI